MAEASNEHSVAELETELHQQAETVRQLADEAKSEFGPVGYRPRVMDDPALTKVVKKVGSDKSERDSIRPEVKINDLVRLLDEKVLVSNRRFLGVKDKIVIPGETIKLIRGYSTLIQIFSDVSSRGGEAGFATNVIVDVAELLRVVVPLEQESD